MKKIGILFVLILLIGCGKEQVTTGTGQTVDEFTRGYQDQIGRSGIAKKGESITLFQEMRITINGNCTYDYAYGERTILNNNPKLVRVYSKDIWNLAEGSVRSCGNSRIDETVYLVPTIKLQELFIKGATKKCDSLREIFDDPSIMTFCQQNFLGTTTFRSENAGLFKTTITLNIEGNVYNVTNDATHLSNKFLWVPYPVSQRTLINGQEGQNHFSKMVIDYFHQTIDERDYDHVFQMDYYEGWTL